MPLNSDDSNEPHLQEDTVTFKRSYFYSVLVVLAFAAGILVGYVTWGTTGGAVQTSQTANQASGPVIEAPVATEEQQYIRYDVSSEDAYAFGPEDAPITIVEFGDFQCPFCRRWHAEVYEPLLARISWSNPDGLSSSASHLHPSRCLCCCGGRHVRG